MPDGQQQRVVADLAKQVVVLRQRRQDQRQARRLRVVFGDGTVHSAEEPFGIEVDFILLAALAMVHG
jgi:hypothetical protein